MGAAYGGLYPGEWGLLIGGGGLHSGGREVCLQLEEGLHWEEGCLHPVGRESVSWGAGQTPSQSVPRKQKVNILLECFLVLPGSINL